MAVVALDRVGKSYANGFTAVKDFSLTTGDGEFVVFVGPSGCGKSTTLRMVAGLEEITSGEIRIGPRVINNVPPKDRDIAMVFQNYALYPHKSVYHNMAFALKLRGLPREQIDARVRKAADMLGLEPLLDRKPGQLSGGQRQRVAVGRAIVREPQAFLFDEPLSNLDAKLRIQTRGELKALHQRLRTTTIYVTHDQEEAMTLGDRIVVMAAGLIQQAAPPMEVYRRPVNRFVAGFVGTPPMNFIAGTLDRGGSGGGGGGGGGGSLCFVESSPAGAPGVRIDLPARFNTALDSRLGQPVVVGIRPPAMADVRALNGHAAGRPQLDARVEILEPLGDTLDALCRTAAGTRLVARLNSHEPLAPGQTLRLALDPAGLHVFEPGDFGRNLTINA
jgi:multiple sugar transport system ATP-binding protein